MPLECTGTMPNIPLSAWGFTDSVDQQPNVRVQCQSCGGFSDWLENPKDGRFRMKCQRCNRIVLVSLTAADIVKARQSAITVLATEWIY